MIEEDDITKIKKKDNRFDYLFDDNDETTILDVIESPELLESIIRDDKLKKLIK